jgi:hypothetical protein
VVPESIIAVTVERANEGSRDSKLASDISVKVSVAPKYDQPTSDGLSGHHFQAVARNLIETRTDRAIHIS